MTDREKAMESALLPCPFCGDPMKHWGHGEVVHVNGDRCIIGKNGFFVAAWSTRALATPATAQAITPSQFVAGLMTDDNVRGFLNQRICCDGRDCGCYGATIGSYLEYIARDSATLPRRRI
jgi:hypothetical protein